MGETVFLGFMASSYEMGITGLVSDGGADRSTAVLLEGYMISAPRYGYWCLFFIPVACGASNSSTRIFIAKKFREKGHL